MKTLLCTIALAACCSLASAATLAVNFTGNNNAFTLTNSGGAFGVALANWTNIVTTANTGSQAVSGATFTWNATGRFNTGVTPTTGEQEVQRGYLDDVNGGQGSTVTISGLVAWLASTGDTSYTIQMIQASDNVTAFQNTLIKNTNDLGAVLATLTNSFTSAGGAGGGATSVSSGLNADTIFLDPGNRANTVRGTIAGIIITSVPEPSVALLGGLGVLGLLRRRRA